MPNVAMWGKALTVMPRITKQDWDGLDLVSRWLIATRSAVIIMTFTSAAFAGLLSLLFWNGVRFLPQPLARWTELGDSPTGAVRSTPPRAHPT